MEIVVEILLVNCGKLSKINYPQVYQQSYPQKKLLDFFVVCATIAKKTTTK